MIFLDDMLIRMNHRMRKLQLQDLKDLDMHYWRFHSLKQEMEVLKNVVLDAEIETFLFIGTLLGHLGIEVACTDLLDVKSIVDFLKQDRCFEHVDQSCASLWNTHESSSVDEVESHAYDEVLSFDDINLHEESCASNIMKVDSFAYMCGKESNVIACLDPCLDNCPDEGLSSSMCWSYMSGNDFCCDEEDMHAIILDDVFLPPSDALSRYPDELWVHGPVWDAEMDSDHVCGIVGGTKVPTSDYFDCDQNIACSQSEDYETFVTNDDDDDDDWGFDDSQIEDNLSMASYVQKAQERLQNLKIKKQAEKMQHVLEKAHSVDVLAQDFELHAGNKAEADIMADMDTRVLMDVCDGRGAMKADMDVMFDKMIVVHTCKWCMLYPFDPGGGHGYPSDSYDDRCPNKGSRGPREYGDRDRGSRSDNYGSRSERGRTRY